MHNSMIERPLTAQAASAACSQASRTRMVASSQTGEIGRMAQYKLHCFCQSGNSYKVALYLACAGLDWEPVLVDFFNGEMRDPMWRERVNETGEAPVLQDGAMKLAQSGVILSYLADKTGTFKPASEGERLEALRWMFFDNHKFASYFATYR